MNIDNYRAILGALVDDYQSASSINSESEAFLLFLCDQVLKKYDLDVDDVEDGITEGAGDGQIDALYLLVNGSYVAPDAEFAVPVRGPIEIEIVCVQAKYSAGFEENPLKLIRSTIADLMTIKTDNHRDLVQYNERLHERFDIIRRALLEAAGRSAKISVSVYYGTKASTSNVHASVKKTSKSLKSDLQSLAMTEEVEVHLLGAKELVDLSRRLKTRSATLAVSEVLASEVGDSFVALVNVGSLLEFYDDGHGSIDRTLFDANVRDYLGSVAVNESISNTLKNISTQSFWWFNNGITIVASNADQKGKKLVVSDPLVVNGLQTSNVISAFLADSEVDDVQKDLVKSQFVLVKVIVPPDDATRDEIIKATNNQTNIPKAYLRGMDAVHRNVEAYLKRHDLYYERRKNQFKNEGKPRSRIITLTELAQSLMSALLFRGADARARPTTLLLDDEQYQKLFSADYDLEIYHRIILVRKRISDKLVSLFTDLGANFRNNVSFHVLSFLSKKRFVTEQRALVGWRRADFADSEIEDACSVVVMAFMNKGGSDRVSKSPDFQMTIAALASGGQTLAIDGQADAAD